MPHNTDFVRKPLRRLQERDYLLSKRLSKNTFGHIQTNLDAETGLALLQAGDERGLRCFIATYGRWIFGKAYRILRNHEETEDVCQQVFLRVSQKIGFWHPEQGAFPSWLNRLVVNLALDAYRKSHRRFEDCLDRNISITSTTAQWNEKSSTEFLTSLVSQLSDRSPLPDAVAASHELESRILDGLKCVHAKNASHATAWTLRHLNGLSIEEIAQVIHQKPNTVKVWIFRANRQLREILERRGVTPETF